METKTLDKIADLTQINHHTEARVLLAKQFEYLFKELTIFEAIKKIHDTEGSLPFSIASYRDEITKRALEKIEKLEGKEVSRAIYNCL